jgi:hypothetical protein
MMRQTICDPLVVRCEAASAEAGVHSSAAGLTKPRSVLTRLAPALLMLYNVSIRRLLGERTAGDSPTA